VRVLHVIARLNLGGTARYITQLASELPKNGIDIVVATGFVQGSEVEDESVQSINVIRIPSLGRSFNPIKDHFAKIQLKKIISQVNPDVIHTHTFKAGFIMRLIDQSIPIVHTFHGHLLEDPEFSGFKSKVIIKIERKLAKKALRLVTVGRRISYELLERRIGNPNQYVNIPPGVIALNVTPKAEALKNLGLVDSGRPIVGWIARVTGVKNPMLALEVARRIPGAHFVLAGGGDLLEKVRSEAPSNVSVIGWAKAEDLLGVADIIFSTSKNEGMPIALIEAQMACKPVVATNVGSVSEIIEHGQTGILTGGSSDSIENAINLLLSDSKMASIMGKNAASKSEKDFSVGLLVENHIKLYKSMTTIND
jgi:glycosyltransferase involved in cell wall biosynthesis